MNIMKPSMILPTHKTKLYCTAGAILLMTLAVVSLFTGKYPLSLEKLLHGDEMQLRIFFTLRFSRMLTGVISGFVLGISGFVYQTVFRNSLASPDIIGISSGASAGAAFGILFFSGASFVTACSFSGAMLALCLTLALARLEQSSKNQTIVLAGIAVHALAQTVLMCLKLIADPEKELASIEYWMMGSLSGISGYSMVGNLILCFICTVLLFLMHRQILLLSANEGEAKMLGVNVGFLRLIVLLTATLAVSGIISMTGLISFIGLLAPHAARLLTRNNRIGTMLLSGILGGILLCFADILVKSVTITELPISIFTSLLGAPFLIFLIIRRRCAL